MSRIVIDEKTLRRLHAKGLPNCDIARELGVTAGGVTRALARLGITRNPRPKGYERCGRRHWEDNNPELIEDFRVMLEEGFTDKAIAVSFGIAYTTVGRVAERLGLRKGRGR